MRKNQSSLTAAGIAISRAIESEKPEDERICYDPYARHFAPGWLYALTSFFVKTGYAEWRGPGVMGFLAARERYIDDILREKLADGLEQLIILGAGYDSRAYRFNGLIEHVKVFEVDHPATQADKCGKLIRVLDKLPSHVIYVPIDFNTQPLDECLLDSGFSGKLKTLFIWQGVSMYLSPEAVDATLRFITNHSAHGSALIFDYIERQALEGNQRPHEVVNMRRYRFMSGEDITYSIDRSKIESFLIDRGFSSVNNQTKWGVKEHLFHREKLRS